MYFNATFPSRLHMGEKKKNLHLGSEIHSDTVLSDASDFEPMNRKRSTDSKKLRRVNPLGMRVVVRIRREANQTDSGLYLPEGSKQAMQESLLAEVVEVASAMDTHSDEETNVSGIPLGAIVLIRKDTGIKVPWDEGLLIVETKEVLAIVHEMSVS